jgi:hypothetical protein
MFVVYISSHSDINEFCNAYGFYTGKCYIKDGLNYPVTDSRITDRTKTYTSKSRAVKGAEAVLNKCSYVLSYKVEEI